MDHSQNLKQPLLIVALTTIGLLAVPLIAMQFTAEVDWSLGDFIIMGTLLFTTGLSYVLVTRYAKNLIKRAAYGLVIGSTFLLIWANLAVGLIGAGPHLGNWLYVGVVAVVIIGTFLSRFSARAMEHSMYATVISLILLTGIALLMNMQEYPGSSLSEILAVNGFFALLYLVAALLFRYQRLGSSSIGNDTSE